ncbi:MAG: zf-HC2 domain-containing protein [Armatimonadetes bacterium]|nr:zf-HC2 domain-containing protein [Armatimonadota bacterium]MCX7969217.1 zf-HC2 domain-containing protein [Armatimonadota bacterium]MDW8143466.1 zf-HC2 domain-containing protein [Armatimonadota bacterium]
MTCKEVIERLSEYWSDELDERTKDEITSHLRGCPSCQNEWATFQAAMGALRSVFTPEPNPELLSRIQSAVIAKQHRKPLFVWRWQWATAVGAAAIIVAIASTAIFNSVMEKVRFPRTYPVVAESPAPLLPSPALKQPLPQSTVSPPSLKTQPSPIEQIVKPRRLTVTEHRKAIAKGEGKKRERLELEESLPSSPTAELPALGVPSGERLPEQPMKDIPADISPPAPQTAPKLAELTVEPRILPFRAEAKLSESVKVPGTEVTEQTHAPQGPIGPSIPQGPAAGMPTIGAPKSRAETQAFFETERHYPMMRQQYGGFGGIGEVGKFGGRVEQALASTPFSLRWSKFEPVVVGKVRLWQLAISSDSPQTLTVFLRPGEKVEVLNAQQPTAGEGKGLVIWRDKAYPNREIFVPILIRANEVGTRKLIVTVETGDGKTFSWWCIFSAMTREEQPKVRRPIALQVDRWTILDLFAHLAWESKVAFIIPEQLGYRTINVPARIVSLTEILASVEQQIGARWQRFGNTFSLTNPNPAQIAPMLKH